MTNNEPIPVEFDASSVAGRAWLSSLQSNVTNIFISGTNSQIVINNGTFTGETGATLALADNLILPGSASVTIPSGSTVGRPDTPTEGMLRFNTSLTAFEAYDGSDWLPFAVTYDATDFDFASNTLTLNEDAVQDIAWDISFTTQGITVGYNDVLNRATFTVDGHNLTSDSGSYAMSPGDDLQFTGGDGINTALNGASGILTINANIATTTEMEAASSTDVIATPGTLHRHPGIAKAWLNFTGTGTATIQASYNITSITDNGVGNYTITIATNFSSANYCAVMSTRKDNNTPDAVQVCMPLSASTVTAGAFQVYNVFHFTDSTNGVNDAPNNYVAFFGDQ